MGLLVTGLLVTGPLVTGPLVTGLSDYRHFTALSATGHLRLMGNYWPHDPSPTLR
jgi:hypothetical protein